jgi:hypothetical protein
MKIKRLMFTIAVLLNLSVAGHAQVKVTIDHNVADAATAVFKFKRVPSPVTDDAAAAAKLLLVEGELDENGRELMGLSDGVLPSEEDQPEKNLFFNAGTGGGRIRLDLGTAIGIAQVNSYSWHPNTRGPQFFRLWASDGFDARFNGTPRGKIDPLSCGWRLIATVDTRPKQGEVEGGQYGVSITDATGSLGKYRYLLFDLYVAETADDYGNTFYSEIDVIKKK